MFVRYQRRRRHHRRVRSGAGRQPCARRHRRRHRGWRAHDLGYRPDHQHHHRRVGRRRQLRRRPAVVHEQRQHHRQRVAGVGGRRAFGQWQRQLHRQRICAFGQLRRWRAVDPRQRQLHRRFGHRRHFKRRGNLDPGQRQHHRHDGRRTDRDFRHRPVKIGNITPNGAVFGALNGIVASGNLVAIATGGTVPRERHRDPERVGQFRKLDYGQSQRHRRSDRHRGCFDQRLGLRRQQRDGHRRRERGLRQHHRAVRARQ